MKIPPGLAACKISSVEDENRSNQLLFRASPLRLELCSSATSPLRSFDWNKSSFSRLSTDENFTSNFETKCPGGIMAGQNGERDHIHQVSRSNGVDRRGFLLSIVWSGAGVLWIFSAAVGASHVFGATAQHAGQVANFAAANSDVTAETIQAAIDNYSFVPKQLTIKAGTMVVWLNKDDTPHTVTSNDNAFSSPLLDTNAKFQFTFAKPGKYAYHCKVHPMMTGVVEVQ
jgi:plastocyanin